MHAQAKVSFENETRVMHLANTASYAELLETVRLKFPNAWPCQIKYLDRSVLTWCCRTRIALSRKKCTGCCATERCI